MKVTQVVVLAMVVWVVDVVVTFAHHEIRPPSSAPCMMKLTMGMVLVVMVVAIVDAAVVGAHHKTCSAS